MRERLLEIIKENGLTAWKFAEILGVQASSISHILSGRNKPSFDFIEKILVKFPELSSDWLILGKGGMYRAQNEDTNVSLDEEIEESTGFESIEDEISMYQVEESEQSTLFTNVKQEKEAIEEQEITQSEPKITDVNHDTISKNTEDKDITEIIPALTNNKEIEKIIVFYKCKTFDVYTPEQ